MKEVPTGAEDRYVVNLWLDYVVLVLFVVVLGGCAGLAAAWFFPLPEHTQEASSGRR